MPSVISFFKDGVQFRLNSKAEISRWLEEVSRREGRELEKLHVVFVDDERLSAINNQFLGKAYYTDVMAFPSDEELGGEIYVSIDRIKENSGIFRQKFNDELHRVILHGLLHFLGYGDKSENEKSAMKAKEDFYLNLRNF